MKIKKGDNVYILVGKDRGKKGRVEKVFPRRGKVIVAGVNVATKHQKPMRGVKQVGRIKINLPIDISNVALICEKCGKYVRIGYKKLADGKKERVCKRCGEAIR